MAGRVTIICSLLAVLLLSVLGNATGPRGSEKEKVRAVTASASQSITYQGVLKDASENPIPNAALDIIFRVYDQPDAGDILWQQRLSVKTDKGGYFNAILSHLDLPSDRQYYLSLQVEGDAEMSPRQMLRLPGAPVIAGSDPSPPVIAQTRNWDGDGEVIWPDTLWGISHAERGIGINNNRFYGDNEETHINLGIDSETGHSLSNASYSTIGGGYQNKSTAKATTVGGGESNDASDKYSTIAGGYDNTASGTTSAIAGGELNTASGTTSAIAGGESNTASGKYSAIAGGSANVADSGYCAIGGGKGNAASSVGSAVGGGVANVAIGVSSVVGGGWSNYVAGDYSAITGGFRDTITAAADYSYLFGIDAKLTDDSTFMVDMPHIRFGDETDGYEFPASDGNNGQVIKTDGRGNLSWVDRDPMWSVTDSVLYTNDYWGLARGDAGNVIYGDSSQTMVNFGVACTTGTNGQNIQYATVTGGVGNKATKNYSTIAGGDRNEATDVYSTIGGGYKNKASQNFSTISGGDYNEATGLWGAIGGGGFNAAEGQYSIVGGGGRNTSSGNFSVISGGEGNTASGHFSAVCGGDTNIVAGDYSAILGGYKDTITASADYSYLFGIGSKLTNDSTFMVDMPHIRFGDETDGYEFPTSDGNSGQVMATDGSGNLSWADRDPKWSVTDSVLYTNDYWGLARGDAGNVIYGDSSQTMVNFGVACTTGTSGQNIFYATVAGGYRNKATQDYSAIGGGYRNQATYDYSTVGGGYYNRAYGLYSTIGGGNINYVTGGYGTIGGGVDNTASGSYSAVCGGDRNTASGSYSSVGGGRLNDATMSHSVIAGGYDNTASGDYSAVAGGWHNIASGAYGLIGGGYENLVEGDYSAIAGGYKDTITAAADYSYLFGIGSKLTQDSTFMVDMPHIRFGDESNGYKFPADGKGEAGWYLRTDDDGNLEWTAVGPLMGGGSDPQIEVLREIIEELRQQNAELERRVAELEAENR